MPVGGTNELIFCELTCLSELLVNDLCSALGAESGDCDDSAASRSSVSAEEASSAELLSEPIETNPGWWLDSCGPAWAAAACGACSPLCSAKAGEDKCWKANTRHSSWPTSQWALV